MVKVGRSLGRDIRTAISLMVHKILAFIASGPWLHE